MLARLLAPVLDFCYPPTCAKCGAAGGGFLCDACMSLLDKLCAQHACASCALPIPAGAACPYCRGKGLYPYQRIVRLGVFEDPLKELVHRMKYQHRWQIAEELAVVLKRQDVVQELLRGVDAIIPVPLHYRRHVARGYNQSEILARAIAKGMKARVLCAARRVRDTESQTAIHSRTLREENMRGAFVLKRRYAAALCGRRILVVDDVMTTGATLKSFARALKKAEPASMCAIVLAVADPRRRGFEVV